MGIQSCPSQENNQDVGLEPDVMLKRHTTGFEFAISQQCCSVEESQKSRTQRV